MYMPKVPAARKSNENLNVVKLREALETCIELEKTDPTAAEFWRRLAGSIRKAISML
jgi:hypothetical protein